jgi:ATP-binding cassette subfamily F protein 3
MREALTLALQETEAAMVLVSHDRHLLRTTVDELWLVADGAARPFDGDLDDYAAWLAEKRSQKKSAVPVAAAKATQREARAADQAAKKSAQAERRKLEREVDKLDKQLAGWQAEKAALDERLADPALYATPDRALMDGLHRRQAELAAAIEAAETRWLDLHEQLEALAVE